MKRRMLMLGLFVALTGLLNAKQTVSKVDNALLQRLCNMKYDEAVENLSGMEPEPFIHHVVGLAEVWSKRADPEKARLYLELALEKARSNQMNEDEAAILYAYAQLLDQQLRLREAIEKLDEAIGLWREFGHQELIKQGLSYKGNLEHRRGDYKASMQTNEALLDYLSTDKSDELLRAHVLYEIAMLRYKTGSYESGLAGLKEALRIYEEWDYSKGEADCLKAFGNAADVGGNNDKAETFYRRAAAKYRKAGAVHGEGNCLFNLGLLFKEQRQFTEAIDSFQRAIAAYTESSSMTGVGIANMEMGRAYCLSGDHEKAETHLTTARTLLTRSKNLHRLAQTEKYLAELKDRQGLWREANDCRRSAARHYQAANNQQAAKALLDAIVASEKKNTAVGGE